MKALWYGEIDDPGHWAARDIRRAAAVIEGRKEAAAVADQFQSIIAGLNAKDPDFHSQDIAALVGALRALGRVDST